MEVAVVGNAANLSANTIQETRKALALTAENVSGSLENARRGKHLLFSPLSGTASATKVVTELSTQGNIVDSTASSLAVNGDGVIVVKRSDGTIVGMRDGFSQGLNKDNKYVLGDSTDPNAPVVMAFRTDEDGNLLEKDGVTPLKNTNDTTHLVEVDLTDDVVRSDATTKVRLNNILNSGTVAGGTGLGAAPTGGASEVQQTVTVYDSLGGQHTVTLTWRKILDTSVAGVNNADSPDASSLRFTDASGTDHDNCDVWQMAVQYVDSDGATQYAKVGGAGGDDWSFANSPRFYFKDGELKGFTNAANNTRLVQTELGSFHLPFTESYGALTVDTGISTDVTKQHSSVKTFNTSTQLEGVADGSSVVTKTDWFVNEQGMLQIVYSNKTVSRYKLFMGSYANADGVRLDGGYWVPTSASGPLVLRESGKSGAGSFHPGKIESSSIDTTQEMVGTLAFTEVQAAAARLISMEKEAQRTIMQAF